MMKEDIQALNETIQSYTFLDFYIYKMDQSNLVLAGSDDFSYYHNIEVHFINPFTVISNSFYSVDTTAPFMSLLEDENELKKINLQYGIVIGNSIFKMISEEGEEFFIAAEKMLWFHKTVKYT